ncbi:MAG: AraC family transcriptional regulator [Flavobacteriaceae bacterium]|nr:AraC family transcriptional regulator [Flavobacteriaceae bacterium]
MKKNVAKNIFDEVFIEEGFYILKYHNQTEETHQIVKEVKRDYIQLHFCIKNSTKLFFNNSTYSIDIFENKSLLLYNPNQDLPIQLEVMPKAKSITFLISIEKFHTFFTQEAGLIHFLNEENKHKKYYYDKVLDPNEVVVLNQMFHYGLHSSLEKLYTKGKVYELLSLYFHISDNDEVQKCPFLEDESNVEKIRNAKNFLIENMIDPPSLNELSDKINLPLQHLKDGFKQIYGETVFTFLLNYKMEYARKLLVTKKYNITETSFEVGYSTPSHFIVAFKKKYGATPKKYLSSL